MRSNAPLLSNPLRFISRLTGNADVDEPRLCVCIEIGQPLLDLMFDLWTGVQAMPRANEVKSWSAMSSYQVFDLVDGPDAEGAQELVLSSGRHEVVFGMAINDAKERGFSDSGDITVYVDGDTVFHVNLHGIADALWTEGVFVLRNLVAN